MTQADGVFHSEYAQYVLSYTCFREDKNKQKMRDKHIIYHNDAAFVGSFW